MIGQSIRILKYRGLYRTYEGHFLRGVVVDCACKEGGRGVTITVDFGEDMPKNDRFRQFYSSLLEFVRVY